MCPETVPKFPVISLGEEVLVQGSEQWREGIWIVAFPHMVVVRCKTESMTPASFHRCCEKTGLVEQFRWKFPTAQHHHTRFGVRPENPDFVCVPTQN